MRIFLSLSALAVRQLVDGAGRAVGLKVAGEGMDLVTNFLVARFSDQSQRLTTALQRANDRAWKALEIALAGESLWTWLDRAENKAFREQVRAFLEASPLVGLPGDGNLSY